MSGYVFVFMHWTSCPYSNDFYNNIWRPVQQLLMQIFPNLKIVTISASTMNDLPIGLQGLAMWFPNFLVVPLWLWNIVSGSSSTGSISSTSNSNTVGCTSCGGNTSVSSTGTNSVGYGVTDSLGYNNINLGYGANLTYNTTNRKKSRRNISNTSTNTSNTSTNAITVFNGELVNGTWVHLSDLNMPLRYSASNPQDFVQFVRDAMTTTAGICRM